MPLFRRLTRSEVLAEPPAARRAPTEEVVRLQRENAALRAEVATLRAEVEALRSENAALRAVLAPLQTQVAELTARLGQHSSNSSKPPSSDPPHRPARSQRTPSGRAPGGQAGHPGHGRGLQPPEQVDRWIELRPVACAHCGALLLGEQAQPVRRQVTDLPVVRPELVEYRCHTLTCLACGRQTAGAWPAELPAGAFGPRVAATVGYLTGRLGVSQREAAEALEALYHTSVSVGSIAALEQTVSRALAEPVAEAQSSVQQQAVVNADETSWRQGRQRGWLWIAVTTWVTVFLRLSTRGSQGAKQLLGESYAGVVGSDRWVGYSWLAVTQRQVCWAHLRRDFQGLVDYGGAATPVGRLALILTARLFHRWHQVRDDPVAWSTFAAEMQPVQDEFRALLEAGTQNPVDKAAGLCRSLLKLWPALWTFTTVPGVEPTNNAAERYLRRAVLWRRRSFGTQSAAGSQFVERVLSAVTTLRQQERDVLDYLTAACTATLTGQKPPSLLPAHLLAQR
jgi:transposase